MTTRMSLRGGEEEHLVARIRSTVSPSGRDAAAVAIDRDHARFDVRQVLAQVAQLAGPTSSAVRFGARDRRGRTWPLAKSSTCSAPGSGSAARCASVTSCFGADEHVDGEAPGPAAQAAPSSVETNSSRRSCTRASGCARSWCGVPIQRPCAPGTRPCSPRRCWSARRSCPPTPAPGLRRACAGWRRCRATVRMSMRSCRSRSSVVVEVDDGDVVRFFCAQHGRPSVRPDRPRG